MQRYIHDRYEFALKEIKQQQLSEYRRKVKEQRKKYKLDVKEEKENLRNSVGIVRDMLKP
jgi:reverse gyrase